MTAKEDELQWSHGPKAVETTRVEPGSSTRVVLQWSHGPKAVETFSRVPSLSPRSGFNGATARRPWRRRHSSRSWSPGPASMEPRPEGRGDDYALMIEQQVRQLQWSHGPKAVETHLVRLRRVRITRASMEPRPEGRGDSRTMNGRLRTLRSFNGATARRPWRRGRGSYRQGTARSFNGATARRPWRPQLLLGVRVVRPASMEPRPEGRGDKAVPSGTCPTRMLQWSHGPKAVETGWIRRVPYSKI